MTSGRSDASKGGAWARFCKRFSPAAAIAGLLALMALVFHTQAFAEAGRQGTIFLEPDILAPDDPSAFTGLVEAGQATRELFDRRRAKPYTAMGRVRLFPASFEDMDEAIEVQVNLEFDAQAAKTAAEKYLHIIGQLPLALRSGLKTVTIHKGGEKFAAGSHALVIHTAQADAYASWGVLEETLFHEATHAALQDYSSSADWVRAQKRDGQFISDYARERPETEDVAESYLMYVAVRHRGGRISAHTRSVVEATMPHRLRFFDSLELNVDPMPSAQRQVRGPAVATGQNPAGQPKQNAAPVTAAGAASFEPGTRYHRLQTRFLEGQNKCLEGNAPGREALLGGAAHLDDCQRVSGQQWRFEPAGDGYFKLRTLQLADRNLCLEGGHGAAHASPAIMRPCGNEAGQFWKVEPAHDGYFRLKSMYLEAKNLCLEGGNGVDKNSAAAHRPCRDVTGQLWKFSPN